MDLVALLVEKRRLAVDRDYREKQEMAALLGECCSAAGFSAACCSVTPAAGGLAGQVRLGRERGLGRCGLQERGRSTSGQARSLSRPRYQAQVPAQGGANPLADSHHRRQVDRLVKGYF